MSVALPVMSPRERQVGGCCAAAVEPDLTPDAATRLAVVVQALADPTRLRVLDVLRKSWCASEERATSCQPSENAGCCGSDVPDRSCGCSAGHDVGLKDIREAVRERYAAAARDEVGSLGDRAVRLPA